MNAAQPFTHSVRATLLAVAVLLLSIPGRAFAGPNAGGTLILSAAPQMVYTTGVDYCGASGLTGCASAVTQVDTGSIVVFHLLAAFPESVQPALGGVNVGLAYDPARISIIASGACGNSITTTPGWPAPASGALVHWNEPQTGRLTEALWFAAYAEQPGTIEVTASPEETEALLLSGGYPEVEDPAHGLGALGFGTPGRLPCPPLGACCQYDGTCILTSPAGCDTELGRYQGDAALCSPGLCAPFDLECFRLRLQSPPDTLHPEHCPEDQCTLEFVVVAGPEGPNGRYVWMNVDPGCCDLMDGRTFGAWINWEPEVDYSLIDWFAWVPDQSTQCTANGFEFQFRNDLDLVPGQEYVFARTEAGPVCSGGPFACDDHTLGMSCIYEGASGCPAIQETFTFECPAVDAPESANISRLRIVISPNPARDRMSASVEVPSPGLIQAEVVNVTGQVVRRLLDESRPAGRRTVQWDGTTDQGAHAASGVYFLRVRTGAETVSRAFIRLE